MKPTKTSHRNRGQRRLSSRTVRFVGALAAAATCCLSVAGSSAKEGGFVLLNQKAIWKPLSHADQQALERAGRDALTESYEKSASVQCGKLRALLEFNDHSAQLKPDGAPVLDGKGQPIPADLHVAQYGDAALQKLQDATEQYLQSLRGGAEPTPDQRDFRRVQDAILAYERRIHFAWKPTSFPAHCGLPGKTPVAAQ